MTDNNYNPEQFEEEMNDIFFCSECQALLEFDCVCDFVEEENEFYNELDEAEEYL